MYLAELSAPPLVWKTPESSGAGKEASPDPVRSFRVVSTVVVLAVRGWELVSNWRKTFKRETFTGCSVFTDTLNVTVAVYRVIHH